MFARTSSSSKRQLRAGARRLYCECLEARILFARNVFAEIAVGGVFSDAALEGGGHTLQTSGRGGLGSGLAREEGYQLLGKNGAYSDLPSQLRQRRPGRGAGEGGEGEEESNNPPQVNFEGYQIINDLVLSVSAIYGVLANDVDDDGPDPLTAFLYDLPEHGTLSLNTDGSFVYDPYDSYVGDDFFVYQAFDGAALSEPMSVYLVINGLEIEFVDGQGDTSPSSDDWTAITDQTETVWVGEEINLRSNVTGIPIWNLITAHEWMIPSKSIAWWGSALDDLLPPLGSKAEVFQITQAMKDSAEISFFFVDGGLKQVKVGITVNNYVSVVKTTNFDVQRPTSGMVVSFPAMTYTERVHLDLAQDNVEFGSDIDKSPGIRFEVINPPANGETNWIQKIRSNDLRLKFENPPDFGYSYSNAVDTKSTSSWLYGFEGTSPPSYPIPGVTNQGPPNTHDYPKFATGAETPSTPYREITKDTKFTMYLMWISDKEGSIWVPLKSADWFYKFKATSPNGSFWTLAPAPATDWERTPTVIDQTQHPEWTSNARSHLPEALP